MRRFTVVAIAAAVAVACSPSEADIVERLDEELSCVDVQMPSETQAGACYLADGRTIVVSDIADDQEIDFFIAISKDNGEAGPWLIGDGFVISFSEYDLALAMRVQTAVGGELRFS